MNRKGKKENLSAAHPGNSNAEKTGLYSERRRAEQARQARDELDKDPKAFLEDALLDRYVKLLVCSELLHDHFVEIGVSDRHGKQRRQVGSYLRTIDQLQHVEHEIRTRAAEAAIEDEDTQPWDHSAIRRRLQAIADDHSLPGGARVAALRLLQESAPTEEIPYNMEFFIGLENMSDEELERECEAFMVPVTTGRSRGIKLSPPREMIRGLAAQEEISQDELLYLYDSIAARFQLPTSAPGNPLGNGLTLKNRDQDS